MDNGLKEPLEIVERALSAAAEVSRQPRFEPGEVYQSVLRWVTNASLQEPPYVADSRKRDSWLRRFWRTEPHLAGVLDSVTAIDKNRSWTLTGGRNQVARYQRVLRESEGGQGWRYFASEQSLSYYTADIGAIAEVGRDGEDGPLRALFHVDSARCRLVGNPEQPLEYRPARSVGDVQRWGDGDFFRCVSLPDGDEELFGLGYCALSRCLELAKLMVAVYQHDLEKLGAHAPKGLLLLRNISQNQWNDAMTVRDATLNNREQQFYGAVSVLASMGPDEIDAKLVALSQLPDGFDLEVFTNQLMYGYALCFGYDPIEFWPVDSGALGRGRETEIQHKKATGKGGMDFALTFQDHLQRELPEALAFVYEERDQTGHLLEAEVAMAWANVANVLYQNGVGILTQEQVKSLLVDKGIIPSAWTETEEDVQAEAGDDGIEKDRLLQNPAVQRAVMAYADEPIVRYRWPDNRVEVLWERGADAIPRTWRVMGKRKSERAKERKNERISRADDVLFEDGDVLITEADVQRAIRVGGERMGDAYLSLMDNEPILE